LTKQTASLSLSKPEITDKIVDTITQLASNFDVIDSSLADKATEVYPEKYGAVGDGVADDRVALTNAFAYAMTNKLPVVLKEGKTYLINSVPVNGNIFDITGALKLRGNATIKMGAVGDYDTIFNLKTGCNYSDFKEFTLDENTTNNPITVNTSTTGKRRVAFYSWNGTKPSFIRFKGVTFNDFIGVWQITLNADNVKINKCTFNYSSAGTNPAYDRTSIYMAGANWNVDENFLNGSANAHTCLETHGSNITVSNNKAINYNNMMYIVNDPAGAASVDNISVIDNNFNCRMGIRLWFQLDNVNVDTVNINNNKIIVTGASAALNTYELTGNTVTVNSVKFTNNIVSLNSQTDAFVQLRNTEGTAKAVSGVTFNDFAIENNVFSGICQYAVKMEVQPSKNQIFKRLNINKNTFNITNHYSDKLFYMIDVPVGFEDIMIFANKFKVLAVTGFTTVRILHGSTASRTIGYGTVKLRQNEYSLPSGITFALASAEGVIFADVKEVFDVDITTFTATALAYSGMIRDIFNQTILFNNGAVTKEPFASLSSFSKCIQKSKPFSLSSFSKCIQKRAARSLRLLFF
jgi:hypothetical protein